MPDDIDAEALAKELGVEPTEPPKPASPPEPPPKGEETPKLPDTTEGAKPPEGEKKGGEVPGEGETPPDPLAEFTKDPKTALKGLLANPILGPMLNQWADTAAKHQVEAAAKGAKDTVKAEAEQAQIEKEDKFFGELSKEDLAKELADSETGKDAAAAYGRYQLRQQQPKGPSSEETNFNIQVAATRSLVVTYQEMVDGSDLPDEVKAELQPEKFTHLGKDALVAWGKAIYEAHVKHGVDQAVESAVEERLAKLDKERPGSGGGRPPGAMPDLMTTPSEVGLTQALAAEEQKRKK